ncbi:PEP-CTERM sorting domain-containing protein [Dapis sp. BLCC M126]|uniref:PEP-CTERM sorting domain-containing protein n=1 Tax=Dapis sp. BLCC M126 TaxID=3400189 RepID=UPI003CF12451
MLKNTKYYLSLILSGFCLTITTFNQQAYALSATASTSVNLESNASKTDDDSDTGNYTLGNQTTKCGTTTSSEAQITRSYSSTFSQRDKTEELSLSDSCFNGKTTTVDASSTMEVTDQSGSYYDWELSLTANVTRQSGSSSGSATARGNDPQYIDGNTFPHQIFEETVTLEHGSSVFAQDEHDRASMTFSRGVEFDEIVNEELQVVQNPFFSIKILASGPSSKTIPIIEGVKTISLLDAIVDLNPNNIDGLKFYRTASKLEEISESELEEMLEDENNGLGTESGLKSDISFTYEWDYSGFDLDSNPRPNPRLIGGGENFAQSGVPRTVPEPTSTFGFLALGVIGATSTLKRKLQSSK